MRLYARGLREPLAFFPRTSWAFVESGGDLEAAAKVFRPQQAPLGWTDSEDAGVRLALRGREPLAAPAADFAGLARAVFAPLRAHLEATA
jgi:exodeoxyribonuclease V gamma subunit